MIAEDNPASGTPWRAIEVAEKMFGGEIYCAIIFRVVHKGLFMDVFLALK